MAQFTRRIEDFTCEHCGAQVKGNGYTNHCPHCLWSRHIDINPGDRAAACGALMEPVRVEGTTDDYHIWHRCTKCKMLRRNKTAAGDSVEALLALAGRSVEA